MSLHVYATAESSDISSGILGNIGKHYMDYKSTGYSETKWMPDKSKLHHFITKKVPGVC